MPLWGEDSTHRFENIISVMLMRSLVALIHVALVMLTNPNHCYNLMKQIFILRRWEGCRLASQYAVFNSLVRSNGNSWIYIAGDTPSMALSCPHSESMALLVLGSINVLSASPSYPFNTSRDVPTWWLCVRTAAVLYCCGIFVDPRVPRWYFAYART